MYKAIDLTFIFILLFSIIILPNFSYVHSQQDKDVIINENWKSTRDNLNITMKLDPPIPLVDQWTEIGFDIRKLDNGDFYQDLEANITITDHDGRLFKFDRLQVFDGIVSVEYIFPDDGQHRIILQLYKNSIAFSVIYFDIIIPHPPTQNDFFSQLFQGLFP